MKLTLWTYEGPPHVGAMRIATAMKDLHFVLHAPQGDTYADLLFTMIERLPKDHLLLILLSRRGIWERIPPLYLRMLCKKLTPVSSRVQFS